MAIKRAIEIETLDRLAKGFQESRGITDKLTTEQMIAFSKEPVASGENKLGAYFDGSLTEITAADLGDITTFRDYIIYQSGILSLEIPSTINKIGGSVWNASTLTTVKYDGTTNDWATKINFTGLSHIPTSLNKVDTMWFRDNQGNYYMVDDILEFTEGIEKINNYSFYNFIRPRNLILPSSMTNIGQYAFYYCSNLVNITLNEGLRVIQAQAFAYCDAIQKVVIPNSVHTLGGSAFRNCQLLNEVRIGNGIESNSVSMSSNAFANCPNLTDIYIDKPEGSVGNSPWGATNAQIHWNTPLPSKEG